MTLTILDIKTIAVHCNTLQSKRLLGQFTAFSDEAIAILKRANDHYEKIPQLCLGLSGKSQQEHRNDLVLGIEQSNSVQFHQYKLQYEQDIYKQRMHHWYIKQNQTLQNNKLWQAFAKRCSNTQQRQELIALKSFWFAQARFSYYTCSALIEIVDKVLPTFESYLALLQSEFRNYQKKLPSRARAELQHAINDLSRAITQEKQDLTQAMWSRLYVASLEKDLSYGDVTIHLVNQLKSINVLTDVDALLKRPRRDLTPQAFQYFHHYIAKEGNALQRQSLHQFIWHQANPDYSIVSAKESALIIPKDLQPMVQPPGLISRWLGLQNPQRNFIQNRSSLVARLRLLPRAEETFDKLDTCFQNPRWQQLCQLTQDLTAEYHQAQANRPKTFFAKLLGGSKEHFLVTWQSYLMKQQRQVLEHKLRYLQVIAEQLKTRMTFELDLKDLCKSYFLADIQQFKDNISQHMHSLGLSSHDFLTYQDYFAVIDQALNLPGELKRIEEEKLKAAQDKASSIEDFVVITAEGEKQLQEADEIASGSEEEKALEQQAGSIFPQDSNSLLLELQGIFDQMVDEGQFLVQDPQFPVHLEQLQSVLSVLYQTDDLLLLSDNLAQLAKTAFNVYLQTWLHTSKGDKESVAAKLDVFERLLQDVAPDAIKTYLQEIIRLRQAPSWFVLQAKCDAIYVSYNRLSPEEAAQQKQLLITHLPSYQLEQTASFNEHISVPDAKSLPFFNCRRALDESIVTTPSTSLTATY